jgi:chemotaxis protein MotA
MFTIIGIVVVFGAIVTGYLMEHGNIRVLIQPAELLIIGLAAVGTLLVANPLSVLKRIGGGIGAAFKSSKFTETWYMDSLKMMYEVFNRARREGLIALENDIDQPDQSQIFSKYPAFLEDHHARDFVCDTLRTALTGGVEPFDIDEMMERDIEVHHRGVNVPVSALSTMADSLPGLGIVAAVLGVVICMGSLGGAPEEIGHKVAAALVGTFLGILLCYGLVGPLASNMAKAGDAEQAYYYVMRVLMSAFIKGTAPIMAVEVGRRAIPTEVRPSFQAVEQSCRGATAAAGDASQAAA